MIFVVTQDELGDVVLYSAEDDVEIPTDRTFPEHGFRQEDLKMLFTGCNRWAHWTKCLSEYKRLFKNFSAKTLSDGSILFSQCSKITKGEEAMTEKYCVHIYDKQYRLLKKYFVDSKEEAVEIHQKYTKKGYHAVIEENPSDPELNWRLMQA